jgi:hypothetical protein
MAGAGRVSDGDEHERAERAAQAAGDLLSIALGSGGDLARALEQVGRDDAFDVLGAVLRELAGLTAAQQLRDVELGGDDDATAEDVSEQEPAAVSDDELPTDPWETGNAGTDAVEHGGRLWEAIEAQRDVAGLLQAVGALSRDDLALVVLERGLSALAERHRPSGAG